MDLPYAGDVLHIVYNPQGYSGAVEKKVNELRDSEQSAHAVIELLLTMLIEWDLQNDDGTPFPVEAEPMEQLPTTFLADVMGAIAEEIRKAAEAGNSSGGGSLQTAA